MKCIIKQLPSKRWEFYKGGGFIKLYHGTYCDNYESILRDGKIRSFLVIKNEITELIDENIRNFSDKELRKNAIFLSKDIESVDAYDYAFVIDINDLDKSLLYVGDFDTMSKLHFAIMTKESNSKIRRLVDKYVNSFISFEKYISGDEKISFPEFLYFEDISLNKATVLVN